MRESGSDARQRHVGWVDALVVAAACLLGAGVFWLVHRALIDDAYITLVQARELARHGHWGLLPGARSNTATSPLTVLLTALPILAAGGPVKAAGVVYLLNAGVLAVGLLGLGRHMGLGRRLAVLAVPLLLLDPLLASTVGLETMLGVTVLVFLAWLSGLPRAGPLGVVAGLAVLVRLDLVVVVGAVLLLRPGQWRRLHLVALFALLVALPWYLFSWVRLGSAVPDTLLIKQGHGWGHFWSGLVTRYIGYDGTAVRATVAACSVGAVVLVSWPWWRDRVRDSEVVPVLGAAAAAYYLTFLAMRVSPFHWYYGVPVAALVLCAAIGMAALLSPAGLAVARPVAPRIVVAAAALAVMLAPTALAWGRAMQVATPLRVALIESNWARPAQYARIGRELRDRVGPHTPVSAPGELGTLLYFCRCTIVDKFSDRGLLRPRIAAAVARDPLMRLNYHWLDRAALHPADPLYRLRFRHGPDPSGRGWNVSSGSRHGHLALIPVPRRPS